MFILRAIQSIGENRFLTSKNHFGGPGRFTYSIHLMGKHIYQTLCHKINGNPMRNGPIKYVNSNMQFVISYVMEQLWRKLFPIIMSMKMLDYSYFWVFCQILFIFLGSWMILVLEQPLRVVR